MANRIKINSRIAKQNPAGANTEGNKAAADGAQNIAAANLAEEIATGKNKRSELMTAPYHTLEDRILTIRGDYPKKRGLNKTAIKKTYKDDPLIEYYLTSRVGLKLTTDEEIFLYYTAYLWYNRQCADNTNRKSKLFWVNKITGRRGDIVIGEEDGKPRVMWDDLSNDFFNAKGVEIESARTRGTLAKRDDLIRNFKTMVTSLATDPKKRVVLSYMENNEFGENILVQRIVQLFTFETVEKDGIKYLVLRFCEYFFNGDNFSYVKYKNLPKKLNDAINKNPKTRTPAHALLLSIHTYLAASREKLKINKEMTDDYNKGQKKVKNVIVERTLSLRTLLSTTSQTNLIQRKYTKAAEDLWGAIRVLKQGGKIHGYAANDGADAFLKGGTRPENFKTWGDFFKKETITLYIIKDT